MPSFANSSLECSHLEQKKRPAKFQHGLHRSPLVPLRLQGLAYLQDEVEEKQEVQQKDGKRVQVAQIHRPVGEQQAER